MSDKPIATPLTDMLRAVPKDYRASWPTQWTECGRETGHAMSPIGLHCHSAADRIEELEEYSGNLHADKIFLTSDVKRLTGQVEELEAEIEKFRDPWVSVNDRLPEPGVPVFASWGNGDITALSRYEDADGWYWNSMGFLGSLNEDSNYDDADDYEPLFWAPMLKAPQIK